MNKKFLLFLILFFTLAFITIFKKLAPECEWIITNCCPENAGAYWECVNVKAYKPKLNCSEVQVICPKIQSPKPNLKCVWEKDKCVVK
jgi:hypothetical protein